MRSLVAAGLVLGIATAPFQCGSGGNKDIVREETAGDALWSLAEDFEARGDAASARRTLEFLVQRYPSSRHVEDAKHKLGTTSDGG
jgi:TolA-binding protein